MAISVMFNPPAMTAAQYDGIMQDLAAAGALGAAGGLTHVCYGDEGKLCVHDIWESEEAFQAFSRILFPLIEKHVGKDAARPIIKPVHNLVVVPREAAASAGPR